MKLPKLRGKIEEMVESEDANPIVVASLIAGVVTGLRACAANPPEGDWPQDRECLAFAEELEALKSRFHQIPWRNRAGVPRPKKP